MIMYGDHDYGSGDYEQWMSTVTGHYHHSDCDDDLEARLLTILKILKYNFSSIYFCPGWGTTSSGGSTSNVLLEVDVQVKFFFPLFFFKLKKKNIG